MANPEQTNPAVTQLLSQLKDIHLPEPVGIWPPALGWWLLSALLLLAIFIGVKKWLAVRKRSAWRREALSILKNTETMLAQDQQNQDAQRQLLELVKRVLIKTTDSPITGKPLAQLLDNSPGKQYWSDEDLTFIATGQYKAAPTPPQLVSHISNWIRSQPC